MTRPDSLPRRPASRLTLAAVAAAAAVLASGCASFKLPGAAAAPAGAPAATGGAAPPPTPGTPAGATAPGEGPAAAAAPAAASGARPGGPPAAAAPAPGQPQPFATVVKDAKQIDGLFTLWQKDDKVWIELKPEDFGRLFLFAPKIAQGIGEAGLFGGTMIGPRGRWGVQQLVEFRRVHNQVQLLARNTEFVAPDNTPGGRAVRAAFSPSLLASTAVASQPHPERKTVLVEANNLFLGDLLGLGISLQRAYRQGYALDRGNSGFTRVRSKPGETVFEVSAHYATASLAQAQPGGPPGAPAPTLPATLPDARSLFFGLHYSLAALPEPPMAPRKADPRVGYFQTTVQDFADDLARTPKQRYVNRWRLEKKDPSAALSEPVKPITFWLDRTIPLKYRDAIARGVLVWNAAFEKIGFKDAIVVKVQPDDADFDTLDVATASIRWMTNAQPQFGAIGPSQVDPRTGEILDADIGFESLSSRSVRALRAQVINGRVAMDWPALMQFGADADAADDPAGTSHAGHAGHGAHAAQGGAAFDPTACQHADYAAEQLGYALDVLAARGEIDPGSPQAEQFVLDYLTDTTAHEVGHTLGLRHNFRSSRIYSESQLADEAFTRANGLAGSVMEYAPINLPAPGERGGTPFQTTLGPYDYWAIEYAYKPLPPGTTPEQEAAALQRIAARSSEPELAYGTDEDNFFGIDPESLQFDLGSDPVAFAKKRIAIARDVIQRQATRPLEPSDDYSVLRRSVTYAVRELGRAGGILARQIGGVRTLRDHPGSGRDPLLPVPPAVQRQALDLLASGLLSADSVVLPAQLQRRLAPDYAERTDAVFAGDGNVATDYSIAAVLLDMRRTLLAQLMSDGLAQRILDSEGKVGDGAQALRLSELYDRLMGAVFGELDARRGDIPAARRELQRDYLNRLTALLVRPGASSRADARSLLRQQARTLLERLEAAQRRKGLGAEAQAHLDDSVDALKQALNARVQRQM